jgi:alpha-galactosidase
LSVSDEKVRASAKQMYEKLAGHGWTYINIDDGWEEPNRTTAGEVVANKKFPDMKGLSDYVHGLGLKLGIYSSPGPKTCGGYLGSYQHEEQDAKTYGSWGIDYLKYDWCSYGNIAPKDPSLDEYKKPYFVMRDALNTVNRDIMFSLCQYGMGDVWKWGAEVGGNSWRTTGDINDSWGSLSGIGFSQDKAAPYPQPGHFNDPDMLIVGKVGWGPSLHNTRLTPDEQYTHISLWCLLSAPLLIGCDMSQFDEFTLNLLTNDEVLAIDQDALGKSARKVFEKDNIQVWVKELEDGNKSIGIFNLNDKAKKTTIHFSDLKLSTQLKLRDVWRQKDLGIYKNIYNASLPAHGVLLLKARVAPGN